MTHRSKPRKQFLWINKDASSSKLSNSKDTKELSYAIHGHVRPQTRGKRKLEVSHSNQSAKRIALDGWQQKEAQQLAGGQRPEVQQLPTPPSSDITCPGSDTTSEAVEEEILSPQASELATPSPIFGYTSPQDLIDPFNCIPDLDSTKFDILQYHLNYCRFYLFRNEAVLHKDAYRTHQSSEFMRGLFLASLQSPMHLDSLLAATAKRMLTLFPDNGEIRAVAQRSTQSVLQQLRSYFANNECVDSKVVADVLMLCMADWFRDDLKAARIHLQPLKHLIKHLGESDSVLRDMICTIDLYVASEAGTPPILPLFWSPEQPTAPKVKIMSERLNTNEKKPREHSLLNLDVILTPEERLKGAVGHLNHLRRPVTAEQSYYLGPGLTGIEQQTAIGFAEAMIQGVFTDELFSIMKQYLPYCALHTYIWLDGHPTNEEISWVARSCKTIIYRMLQIGTPIRGDSVISWLSECVRLTLVMFCNYGPNPMAYRASQKIMPRLKRAVEGYEAARLSEIRCEWQPTPLIEIRLNLWFLIGGVYASHEHPKEHEWFVNRAARIAKSLGIRNYVQLHLTLGHFGLSDTLHLAAVSTVLERMTAMQSSKVKEAEIRPYLI